MYVQSGINHPYAVLSPPSKCSPIGSLISPFKSHPVLYRLRTLQQTHVFTTPVNCRSVVFCILSLLVRFTSERAVRSPSEESELHHPKCTYLLNCTIYEANNHEMGF